MENVWNGAFAPYEPTLQKSVGSSRFISVCDMSKKDWQLLDWDNLSNQAKNKITEIARQEPIVGYILFQFVKKGNARDGYFDPVGLGTLPDLTDALAKPAFSNFGSSDESLTPLSERVNSVVTKVGNAAFGIGVAALFASVAKILDKIAENSADKAVVKLYNCVKEMFSQESAGELDELDATLAFVTTVLHYRDIEFLEEWAQEAEQILGDAEDKGLI